MKTEIKNILTEGLMIGIVLERLQNIKETVKNLEFINGFTKKGKDGLVETLNNVIKTSSNWKKIYDMLKKEIKKNGEKKVLELLEENEKMAEDMKNGVLSAEGFSYCIDNLFFLNYFDKIMDKKSDQIVKSEIDNEIRINAATEFADLFEKFYDCLKDNCSESLKINDEDEMHVIWAAKSVDILLACINQSKEILNEFQYYSDDVAREFIRFTKYVFLDEIHIQINQFMSEIHR